MKTGGKYWGARFEDLCRGHRLYVLQPNAGPNERLDLHTSPDGDHVGAPVDYPECTLCRKAANEHGQGLHGVSAHGCPLCGGDLERKQSVGRHAGVNYTRCPNCVPDTLLEGQCVFNWPIKGWHPGDETTLREWLRERLF